MEQKTRSCAGISATGNWYIDAGIVGFLRYLHEDVNYSKEEIKNLVYGNSCIDERVLSDFGLALWLDKLKLKRELSEKEENRTNWENFKNKLKEEWKNRENKDLKALTSFLKEKFCNGTEFKIGENVSLRAGMLFNFKFFNTSKLKNCTMFDDFYNYMTNKEISKEEQIFDKTINKFLPSVTEFPNEFIRSITLNDLENHIPNFRVFFLSFERAFVNLGRWYFFHSPDIMESFNISLNLTENKSRNDSVVTAESEWTYYNFQVIIYSGFDNKNQEIAGVSFLPLDVATAKILKSNTFKKRLRSLLREFPVAEESGNNAYTNALELLVEKKPLSAFMISLMLRAFKDENFKKEFDNAYYYGIYWATAEMLHRLPESSILSESDKIFRRVKNVYSSFKKLLETSKYDKNTVKNYFLNLTEAALKNNVYEFKFIILRLLQDIIDSTTDKEDARRHVTYLLNYMNLIENNFQPKTVPILTSLYEMLK